MEIPRIAVTGIDGAGKSTVVEAVLANPRRERLTLKVARPTKIFLAGVGTLRAERYMHMIDALHRAGDATRSRSVISAVNAVNMLGQSRLLEPMLARWFRPESIWYTRDRVVDPTVYSGYYLPGSLKETSVSRLAQGYKRLYGSPAQLIFHLKVPPEIALERIDLRIASEQGKEVDRAKWRHMHETADSLGLLAARYEMAFDYVSDAFGTKVVSVDTEGRSQEEVVDIVGYYGARFERGLSAEKVVV